MCFEVRHEWHSRDVEGIESHIHDSRFNRSGYVVCRPGSIFSDPSAVALVKYHEAYACASSSLGGDSASFGLGAGSLRNVSRCQCVKRYGKNGTYKMTWRYRYAVAQESHMLKGERSQTSIKFQNF